MFTPRPGMWIEIGSNAWIIESVQSTSDRQAFTFRTQSPEPGKVPRPQMRVIVRNLPDATEILIPNPSGKPEMLREATIGFGPQVLHTYTAAK